MGLRKKMTYWIGLESFSLQRNKNDKLHISADWELLHVIFYVQGARHVLLSRPHAKHLLPSSANGKLYIWLVPQSSRHHYCRCWNLQFLLINAIIIKTQVLLWLSCSNSLVFLLPTTSICLSNLLTLRVHGKGYFCNSSCLLTLRVHGEGYFCNALCTLI